MRIGMNRGGWGRERYASEMCTPPKWDSCPWLFKSPADDGGVGRTAADLLTRTVCISLTDR